MFCAGSRLITKPLYVNILALNTEASNLDVYYVDCNVRRHTWSFSVASVLV